MEMIHFRGMHCFHDCVISLANHLGVRYSAAFATLWSETDFRYDPYREMYLTKRLITNLEALGAKVECFGCFARKDTDGATSMFRQGEYMIVGMDAFHIPWNQFYRTFHGPHYFIAQHAKAKYLLCFDPTYAIGEVQIDGETIAASAFDICRVSSVPERPGNFDVIEEARAVESTHPQTSRALLASIHNCVNAEQTRVRLLARYIDALIRNRYLFLFFLEKQPLPNKVDHLLWSADFFAEWTAIKNGLYKAAVCGDRERVLNAVCDHLCCLMEREIAMARAMIGGA